MSKIWIFGDSHSEPFSKVENMWWKRDYINWKGYIPKYFGDYIFEDLNLIVKNNAIGGTDNHTIFESVVPFFNKIDDSDIIIIGWSNTIRFRVVNKMGHFNTIRPLSIERVIKLNKTEPYLDFSEESLREMVINRDNQNYITETNNFIKTFNFIFRKNKIIHWSPFMQHEKGLLTTVNIPNNSETINDETNGSLPDFHYSESSHKIFSDIFLKEIKNTNIVKDNLPLI
jgi:hypothetical protein